MNRISFACLAVMVACTPLDEVGKAPEFTPADTSYEVAAMSAPGLPELLPAPVEPYASASTWSRGRGSLLGDRRARDPGDIVTVVIDIDDGAKISNSTNRSRSGSESLGIPQFFGLPQSIDADLPEGASMANAVETSQVSSSSGDGSVNRSRNSATADRGHGGFASAVWRSANPGQPGGSGEL